jgi:hypothetical protein
MLGDRTVHSTWHLRQNINLVALPAWHRASAAALTPLRLPVCLDLSKIIRVTCDGPAVCMKVPHVQRSKLKLKLKFKFTGTQQLEPLCVNRRNPP